MAQQGLEVIAKLFRVEGRGQHQVGARGQDGLAVAAGQRGRVMFRGQTNNIAKPNDASLPHGKPPSMACSIVGGGSMGPPSLHMRSFQL